MRIFVNLMLSNCCFPKRSDSFRLKTNNAFILMYNRTCYNQEITHCCKLAEDSPMCVLMLAKVLCAGQAWPSSQGRTEVTWRPGHGASLAPPCSNLSSFGSKCTVSTKVLVTLLGLFGARGIVPPRYAPASSKHLSMITCKFSVLCCRYFRM